MSHPSIVDCALFDRFQGVLNAASPPVLRDPRLVMDSAGYVQVYYAPFEYINPEAKILLVGITPGPTQMVNANNAARIALQNGLSPTDAIRKAKETAAFSGEPMRGNLIKQMNHWGFHDWLGLKDASELFGTARHLVQTTSLLRYPVFVDGKDYAGTPNMLKHPLLRQYLMAHFVKEVQSMPEARIIGLGVQVQSVLDVLAKEGLVRQERLIKGMLHPSGNNTYRIKYLLTDRNEPAPHATNSKSYDDGRAKFRAEFLGA